MKDSIAIIRDRYQLTIPEEIRKYLAWTAPRKVVRLVLLAEDRFLVEPYSEEKINWQKIWQELAKIKRWGRKISLAEFVIKDRQSH